MQGAVSQVIAATVSFSERAGFPPGTIELGSASMIVRQMRGMIGKLAGGGRR